MKEYNKYLNNNYLHKIKLSWYNNNLNNNGNFNINFNAITNEAKNIYEEIIINYSKISTGYHKIYNSSLNYLKFQNGWMYKLKLGGYEEIEMIDAEQRFLNGVICLFRPKNIGIRSVQRR